MEVVQIESPQEADRFARLDAGHKHFFDTDRNGPAASQDGKSTHLLHHLHLDVPLLGAHLDAGALRLSMITLSGLVDIRVTVALT